MHKRSEQDANTAVGQAPKFDFRVQIGELLRNGSSISVLAVWCQKRLGSWFFYGSSVTHANHHMAGLDLRGGRSGGFEAEFHHRFVADHGIDQGFADQLGGAFAIDRAFFDVSYRSG